MEENELYTFVRGVQIPTFQISNIEAEYGVKLVPDTEWQILKALDLTLQKYRLAHDNKDPDVVMLREYPDRLFKYMVLNVDFLGMSVPGPYNKPCWFWFKKNF